MTGIRGGLRPRFVSDSFRVMVLAGLIDLGWFADGRQHAPLVFAEKPKEWATEVPYNTFSITPEVLELNEGGLGNQPAGRTRMYLDVFGENDVVATHFCHDVRDILLGKMSDAGRTEPECAIFDMRADPPTAFTVVDIADVRIDRSTGFPRDWQRHWFVVSCWLEDDYLEDSPTANIDAEWSASMALAWELVL